MIEVIQYQNRIAEEPLEAIISNSYDEVRKLLPDLPENVQIYFGDYGILPETGVGGFAYSREIITISIDPNFEDKAKQIQEVRSIVFHEAFHQFQDYTGASRRYSAIESSINEGMATVFEREYTGVFQPYGDYRQTPEAILLSWAEELKKIDAQDFANEEVYGQWKFYHSNLKERWIAYKVGTWITDRVLADHNLTILDLSSKNAKEVLVLFEQ